MNRLTLPPLGFGEKIRRECEKLRRMNPRENPIRYYKQYRKIVEMMGLGDL